MSKMETHINRIRVFIPSAVLALLLAAALPLTSCGRGDKIEDGDRNDYLKGVYRAVEIPAPGELYEPFRDEAPRFSDGVFSIVFRYDNYEDLNAQTVVFDTDGNIIDGDGVGTDESYPPTAEGAIVQRVFNFEDGGSAAYEYLFGEKNYSIILSARDKKGELIFSTESLPEWLSYRKMDLPSLMAAELLEVKNILPFTYAAGTTDERAAYAVLTSAGLTACDDRGQKLWLCSNRSNPTALISTGQTMLYLGGETDDLKLKPVNINDGSLGDTVDLPPEVLGKYFYTGGGHDLYIRNNSALWGVDFSDDGSGGLRCDYKSTINWVNSDLVPADICTVCIADERTMALTLDSGGGIRLYLLKAVPDAEVVEKKNLTMAMLGSNNNVYISRAIADYNLTNDEYRISVIDMTMYSDEAECKQKADMLIAEGKTPDIWFYFQASNADKNISIWSDAGVFCDLIPLMRADPEFDFDDLLGYTYKPCLDSRGRLNYLPLRPRFGAALGCAEYFDGPVTPEELLEIYASLPEGVRCTYFDFSLKSFLTATLLDDCIDLKNGTCDFSRYKELLALIDAANIDMTADRSLTVTPGDMYEAFRKGEIILIESSYVNGFGDWAGLESMLGKPFSVIGLPNAKRRLCAGNYPLCETFMISETCADKAAALGLLKKYFAMVHKDTYDYGSFMPPFFASEEREKCESMRQNYVFINRGDRIGSQKREDYEKYPWEGTVIEVTDSMIDSWLKMLDGIERTVRYDNDIYGIYREEISSDQGVDKIADNLQRRLGMYLAERAN